MRIRNYAAAVATSLCFILAGCGAGTEKLDDSLPTEVEQDMAEISEWTAGIVVRPGSEVRAAMLVALRSASHDGFDRIVFEFDERVPGYHIEYIDRPVRKCGSGQVTQVAGDGWLELRLSPANAHTEEGRPTITEGERMPNLALLSELELTCDFEAVVTWVLGVEAPNRYRVRELSRPPRLVVDLQH